MTLPNIDQEARNQINLLKRELDEIRYLLTKKTGGGSNDIKGKIVNPSTVTGATVAAGSITKTQLSYEEITVNVSAGQTSGTGTATAGSVIIGWRPSGNLDQVVDQISISGTTITVQLGVAATAQCNFVVICLKA